jgi:hypothetical protein
MCFHLLVWQQLVKSIRLVVKIWNNTCHQLCLYFSNCHLSVYNRKQSYKIEGSQEFKKKMLNTIVKAFQSFDHGRTWWSLFQKGVMLNKLDIVKITTIYCRYLCVRKAWRYQRGNQNKYIKEEQTTQCPNDTKEVIRISISKRNREHNSQKIPKR